jgi:hypothetical protein
VYRVDTSRIAAIVRDGRVAIPRSVAGMREQRHHTQLTSLGEGLTQASCECGWCSEPYGAGKDSGTMDALQRAQDAADLHEWEASLDNSR